MTGDRNLLFGILAVQLRGVPPERLIEAGSLWAEAPSRPLNEILVERGALTEDESAVIARLVGDAVEAAGGDPAAAIAGLGFAGSVETLFGSSREAATTVGPTDASGPRSGQPVAALREEPGRYASDREFARGGMGRILLVHDALLERDVALKELLPLAADTDATMAHDSAHYGNPDVIGRFIREAKVTAQLEHPGIVPVYEVGRRENGVLYYTMRLVQGRTLSQAIGAAKDLAERLRLINHFLDLCHAISYAHSRGVIHRDIKPANVMIGRFGETVVIDWGLAKTKESEDPYAEQLRDGITEDSAVDDSGSLRTRHGARLGTPHYMAPEQAQGRIGAVDERSDVFALGAVLYEILTGRKAFSGPTVHAILAKVVQDDPEPIQRIEPKIPPELAGICLKALRKRPGDRYQSAAEFAEDIARYQAGALVQAYRYTAAEVLRHYYRRHRTLVHTVAAGLMLLAGLGVYSYAAIARAYEREYAQRLSAQAAQEKAERAAAEEAIARAVAEEKSYLAQIRLAEWYLGGRRFAEARDLLWAAPPERRGWEWGHLLLKASNERLVLENAGVAVWSPDGERIAVAQRDALPRILQADDGREAGRLRSPGRDAGGPPGGLVRYGHLTYSPDGRFLAGATVGGETTVWDTASLEATAHRRLSETDSSSTPRALAFSPDGALLAAVHAQGVTIVTAGSWDVFATVPVDALDAAFLPAGKGLVIALRDARVTVWDPATRQDRYTVAGTAPIIHGARGEFGVLDGGNLVFRSGDSDRALHTVTPPSGATIQCWAWSPGDRATLAYAQGEEVSVVDYATGAPLVRGRHGADVTAVRFGSDGAFVAAMSGADSRVSVWDARSGAPLAQYVLPLPGGVRDIAVNPRKAEILAAPATPDIQRIVVRPAHRSLDTRTAAYPVRIAARLDADRDRTVFATGSSGQITYFIDRESREGYRIAGGGDVAGPADLSPDGRHAVLTLDGFTCAIWDVSEKRVTALFTEHERPIDAAAFSPDGRTVASGDAGGTVLIWDAATATTAARFAVGADPGHLDVAFAPDGEHVIVATRNSGLSEWRIGRGERTGRFEEPRVQAVSLYVSETSPALVVAGTVDGAVSAWDWASGAPVSAAPALASGVLGYVPAPQMGRSFAAIASGLAVLDAEGLNHITTVGESPWRASRSLLTVDAGEIWAVDSANRIASLQSLPPELPLAAATPESFEEWRRREWANEAAETVALTDEIYAVQTTEWWDRIGRALDGYLAGAALEPQGETALAALQASLRLFDGETIASVTRRSQALPDIAIGRASHTVSVHAIAIEPDTRSMDVPLPRPAAIDMLESQLRLLESNAESLVRASRRNAATRGVPLPEGDAIDGLTILGSTARGSGARPGAVQLAPGDRIVGINGQRIDSVTTIRRLYAEILSGLRGSAPATFEVAVERGFYRVLRLRYAVE